jgi:N-acetylmuramoyl-L-alanine amidase
MISPLLWIPARTVWGEARGEGAAGMAAVAHVLANRLASKRWGPSLNAVCLWPYQFSCWLPGDPNLPKLIALPDDDATLALCAQAVDDAMSGAPDPVGGATHYYADMIPPPGWARGLTPRAHIGHHLFFAGVN